MNETHGSTGDPGRDELDLYVDGLLDDERRAAFERRLFKDPELAAELERQRALDARLGAAFPVPEDAAVTREALAGTRTGPAAGRPTPLARYAAAASIFVALGLGLWGLGLFGPGTSDSARGPGGNDGLAMGDAPPAPAACTAYGGLYAELAAEIEQSVALLEAAPDLGNVCGDRYGMALAVDASDAVPIEGPFASGRWPTATVLCSPQEPEPILIVVDEVARDPRPVLESGSPAHLFRRELGDLVLYEITPWDRPRTLDLFRLR